VDWAELHWAGLGWLAGLGQAGLVVSTQAYTKSKNRYLLRNVWGPIFGEQVQDASTANALPDSVSPQ